MQSKPVLQYVAASMVSDTHPHTQMTTVTLAHVLSLNKAGERLQH